MRTYRLCHLPTNITLSDSKAAKIFSSYARKCLQIPIYVSLSTSMMFIIQAHCTSIALHPNISSANWCSNFLTFCSTHEKGKKLVRLRSLKQFLCFHFIKHTGHIVFITWFQQHNGFFVFFISNKKEEVHFIMLPPPPLCVHTSRSPSSVIFDFFARVTTMCMIGVIILISLKKQLFVAIPA